MDGVPLLQSENDVVLESGNYSVNVSDTPINVQQDSQSTALEQRRKRWELNYHEAAIYLQEGSDNDKFYNHPGCLSALPTYLITHNTFFYVLDLLASLGLLLLALVETPRLASFTIPVAVHSSIELLCLLVIGLELCMRLKWLGCRSFFTHVRTVFKFTVLVIQVAESITVLSRQASHVRVTRALRPVFLLDSYYCRGVRRFSRQIIQSLPPILDMMTLLLFFMLIFSLLGFYLFSGIEEDNYFKTIEQSFISLFVLLTTANFPDVMMPAYAKSRWSVLFFVTYLALELYFLMNLLLAVVYDVFSRLEKKKVKKLWVHKRIACSYAFKLLISKQHPDGVSLRHFGGVMSYYKPKLSRTDVYLIFKWLNTSNTGFLSRDEFSRVYEVADLGWKELKEDKLWFSDFREPFKKPFTALNKMVTSKPFEYVIYFIIAVNFLAILVETIVVSVRYAELSKDERKLSPIVSKFEITWYAQLFVALYCLEALLKILGLGPIKYFSSGWNIFDFVVTLTAVIGLILQVVHSSFYYMVILRPFRLFRLFKMRRSFRDVLGTLFILLSRMASLAVMMLVLYYFFSIIGMEAFAKYSMKNCCVNSSVESNYVYDNLTGTYGYYYLNNFENIISSYVTLFELTVVNNWFIIMEGYAWRVSQWSRIYFMLFYIITMVVMTVVVAFILEAFLFRIQYRNKMQGHDMDHDAWMRVDVGLSEAELRMCRNKNLPYTGYYIKQRAESIPEDEDGSNQEILTYFRGSKLRGKMDFSLRMYEDEIAGWTAEAEVRNSQPVANGCDPSSTSSSLRLRNNTV